MDAPRVRTRRCGFLAAALVQLTCIAATSRADSIDQITVQADGEKLRQKVDGFVSSAIVKSNDQSLMR
jgi:hypothetical protein